MSEEIQRVGRAERVVRARVDQEKQDRKRRVNKNKVHKKKHYTLSLTHTYNE